MKRLLAFLLLTVLCLALCAPASAEGEYATTQDFLKLMDEKQVSYTLRGVDEDDDEHVRIMFNGENASYAIDYFFEEDFEHTSIFVWYVIEFDSKDTLSVMQVCNELNARYNYTCWYVDESDNTVTCSMNLIYRDDNVGLVVFKATSYLTAIVEEAYPYLAVYAK